MVVHEHIGVQMKLVTVPVDSEDLEKLIVVGGLFEDLLALVPPCDHVVECTFKLDAGFPWHAGKLSWQGQNVNSKV